MKRKAGLAAVTILAVCFGSVVRADSVAVEDPAEGYPVDITSADHRHPRVAPAAAVAHTIRAAGEWASADMLRGQMRLRLIGAGKPAIRFIELQPNTDGSIRGVFNSSNRLLGHVYAWRPDTSTLRVEFARSLLDGATAYRWSFKLFQTCEGESEGCAVEWDRVPDEGSVLHKLRR